MPRLRDGFPRPKKEYHHGVWRIVWRWNGKKYTVATRIANQDDDAFGDIERYVRLLSNLLASNGRPELPPPWNTADGVKRYLDDRFGDKADSSPATGDWLADYELHILDECSKSWAKTSLSMLKALDAFVPGGIRKTDRKRADMFLKSILDGGTKDGEGASKGNKPATRNRTLAACSRFFNWLVETERHTENPFAKIKSLKEEPPDEIVYCTEEERDRILAIAAAVRPNDWIAVAIAFYAGCRREEIFRLDWKDVNLRSRRLSLRITKNDKPRTTPMATVLYDMLSKIENKNGYVVPRIAGEAWATTSAKIIEAIRDGICMPKNPGPDDLAREPAGKHEFLMTEGEYSGQKNRIGPMQEEFNNTKARARRRRIGTCLAALCRQPDLAPDGSPWIPAERINWNAWRHTFATLRVQAGVSLDKVSAWMGNTPEVCRRHYAQFVPRDKHDEDIDK